MKTILSLIISCFTAISVFAQTTSTLTINVRGANNDRIIVDGKSYDVLSDINNSNVNTPINITDLQPGQHTLQVVRTDEVGNTGTTTSFNLRSGYDLMITVLGNGSLQQREKKWGTDNTGTSGVPMTDANFNVLYRSVINQRQANTRLNLVNNAFVNANNYFTTAQARQLIQLINSQNSRLSLAKSSYRGITDPANFIQVYSLLNSTAFRNDLAAYVSEYDANNSNNNTGSMTSSRFNNFYRTAQRQTSTSGKVSYISDIFTNTNNYYTVAQARQLIQLVSGETNRLYLSKQSYRGISNPENFSKIHELLSNQTSRNELTTFVNSYNGNNPVTTQTAMSDVDFNTVYRGVEGRYGLGAKMSALTDIFNRENNFFTVAQAKQLIQLVSSESNRLQLAKSAYNDVVDPVNFSQLYDILASQSSRTELDTYVRNNYDYKGGTTVIDRIPMTDANFNTTYSDISNRWGLGAKMSALTDVFNNENNYFTVAQAKQLVQLVSDENNRLQLAKSAYSNITDPQNFNLMYDVLASQTKRNELTAYVNTYSYNK